MIKIFKYMKKKFPVVAFIIVLLAVQAVFDLALPDYTANIVNIGIAQNGIESPVPDAVLEKEMDNILLFTDAKGKEKILDNYTLLEPDTATEKQIKEYPSLFFYELEEEDEEGNKVIRIFEKEPVYVLNEVSDETRKELEEIFPEPLLMKWILDGGMMSGAASAEEGSEPTAEQKDLEELMQGLMASIPPEQLSPDVTIFQLLKMLPEEQKNDIVLRIKEQLPELPENQLKQVAIVAVVEEYKEVGINTGSIQTRYILLAGAQMLLISLGSAGAAVFVTLLSSRLAAYLGKTLRRKVFGHVLKFSSNDMEVFGTASLITRSTNDIQQVQQMMTMLFRMIVYAPIMGIYGFIKVLNTDGSMSWIIGIGVFGIACLIAVAFKFAMPKFKQLQSLVDKVNLVAREILTGLPVIRAFANARHEEARFDDANKDLTRVNLFVNRVMSIMMPSMMLMMNGITLLIIWVGAGQVNNGNMQIGNMMAFMQYAMQVLMSFLMISMVSIFLPRASISAKRIMEILDRKPSITDVPESQMQSFLPEKAGVLEFRDVYFRYPGAQEDVLRNISFTAQKGQTTAIIGSTGSGKSTLINLIPRFFDVTGGKVLVDGVDVRKVPQQELRKRLGFVPQKGVLFSGTIESNIKLGIKDADEAAVERAARIAQAAEFIEEKPEKYQSEVSQGGTNVSGGQRQRLAIARAIVKNPEIYVFDDSFSALDYKTDRILRQTLKEELSEATVVIVAQRISTILHADQIVVLDEGEIAGIGTHTELLKNCDVYYQIASSQLTKEELEHE